MRRLNLKVEHATGGWRHWSRPCHPSPPTSSCPLPSLTSSTAVHCSIPSLLSQQMGKAICLTCCERLADSMQPYDSYVPLVSTSPLCLSLSLSLPPPLCLPLKANLVAAFEQSLALMTARLETLSVCSDQKVLVPTAVKPTETFVTVYILLM